LNPAKPHPASAHLPAAEKRAIAAILTATKVW